MAKQTRPLLDSLVDRRWVLKGAAAAGAMGLLGTAGVVATTRPALAGPAELPTPSDRDFFVDPVGGDDSWAGDLAARTSAEHGPVRTLETALSLSYQRAGELATAGESGEINVWLRGGAYRRTEPLVITPHGTPLTVSLRAYPDEDPVMSGSEEITGWAVAQLNGKSVWRTVVPDVAAGTWFFRQLFVEGAQRPRPRLPKTVNATLEEGGIVTDPVSEFYVLQAWPDNGAAADARTFVYEPGDIDPSWHNLTDVDVVAMRQWYDQRSPIVSVDATQHACTVSLLPYFHWNTGNYVYYVENVREALTEPGEWYLDRSTGELYYYPKPGETLGSVSIRAPRTRQLLTTQGTATAQVTNVNISGLTFEETSWDYWVRPTWLDGFAGAPTVGTIVFQHASGCSFTDCVVRRTGEYAISVEENCQNVEIARNEIAAPGAGGIKAGSYTKKPGVGTLLTDHLTITDNHIHDTGQVFHLGAGILAMEVGESTIAHNHIHDLYYTGIAVGWTLTFTETATKNNTVESNYVHDLGKGLLSDLAGIYTIGNQPGTVIDNNLVHTLTPLSFSGFHGSALYGDRGTSNTTWTNNVTYDTPTGYFSEYGVDNTLHNNILAKTTAGTLLLGNDRNGSPDPLVQLSNNIFVVDSSSLFLADHTTIANLVIESDDNLLWNTGGAIDAGADTGAGVVKIVAAADGFDVPGASVFVDPVGAPVNTFVFTNLPSPVTLAANSSYYIVMATQQSGAQWYNATPVQTTTVASVIGSTYKATGYLTSSDLKSFGPVNFRYVPSGASQSVDFVTGATLTSALRSDYSGFVGMEITVGATPVVVTALGRLATPVGPTWWAQWQQAGFDAHSVVADPKFVDYAANNYALQSTSPAPAAPVGFQPIDLSTIGPR